MLEYAHDRPWPGSSAWSDAVSRNALDVIANGVEHLTGFTASCINVVHRGTLRTVAVAAPLEQRELLMDSQMPADVMEAELASAEDWGRFKFLSGQGMPPERIVGVVFDVEALDGPDAWDPNNILAAPIRDDQGRMVGLLAVDLPVTGREPDAATRERLDHYAELVSGTVLMALERDDQQERIRMARATRQVVSAATDELSMQAIFEGTATTLLSGFGARSMWLHTFDADERFDAVHFGTGTTFEVPAELVPVAERAAVCAWKSGVVGILSPTEVVPAVDDELRHELGVVLDEMAERGIASVLFIPIGAATQCLGSLLLSRGPQRPTWTPAETEAGRDIGLDLGRSILNVRAFEREQRAVQELQALDTYKSQLVATLSHELKTPLASILGNLEFLEDDGGPTSSDGQRSVAAISRGAQRLVRVVDDLMLLAKVGDPGNQLIARPVDLSRMVEEVVELTAATARAGDVTVEFTPPVHEVLAIGDADELDRVVTNLMSNALKYTPAGGLVTLDVRRHDGHAVLTCTDTGIGIGDTDRARLFREFFRSPDPAAQGQPGTGLGLAIADRIVRRHGGQIQVESAPGAGSTFRVLLPEAPVAEDVHATITHLRP